MAKTAAERQKAYRERRATEAGEQRINTWVNARAHKTLASLAIRYGVTQKIMLERLILNADDGLIVAKPAKTPLQARATAKPDKQQPPGKAAVARKRKAPKAPVIATPSQATLWDEPLIEAPAPARKPRATRSTAP